MTVVPMSEISLCEVCGGDLVPGKCAEIHTVLSNTGAEMTEHWVCGASCAYSLGIQHASALAIELASRVTNAWKDELKPRPPARPARRSQPTPGAKRK